MRAFAILALLAVAPFTNAISQQLQPGQRVRVTVPSLDLNKHETIFQRVTGDTLVLSSASYLLSDVERLDRWFGKRSHPWLGAGIGFLLAAVPGAIVLYNDCASNESFLSPVLANPTACAAFGGALFGVGGGLIGLVIGDKLMRTDRWEEVPLDRLRVGVLPQREGFGLAASIAF